MSNNGASFLRVSGAQIVDAEGTPVTLYGIGLAGWLNMENWITGFPGYEAGARASVGQVLGPQLRDFFFERFIEHFFTAADAEYLASLGFNMVRLPFSYKYLESDDAPFEIREEGFRYLDRVVQLCAQHGIRTVLDLHTVPGWQHQDWHCDNPSHTAQFWQHRTFQDRTVHLWRAIAARYKDNPWVAGYNPINEPADPSAERVGPFYQRLVDEIRKIDTNHILFLDGNRYALDFHFFGEPWPNTVYCPHDYPAPGYTPGSRYPGRHNPIHVLDAGGGKPVQPVWDVYWDRKEVEQSFLWRTVYMRETGTPIVVGEFNAVFPEQEEERLQLLGDQLDVFRKYQASWTYWSYKDVGVAAPLRLAPDSPYMERMRPMLEKKTRLAVDLWGGRRQRMAHVLDPIYKVIATECPDWNPYPWGYEFMVCRLVLQILFSEALLPEFGELFRGMSENDIDEMMRSFRLENCRPWQPLIDLLQRDIARRRQDPAPAAVSG
ncbi:MAG: endoglucanase [Micromonosporaceae bacterium]